jgi:hypothetical protein
MIKFISLKSFYYEKSTNILFPFLIGMFPQYRINKLNYNAHDYMHQPGDRYDPTLAGVASFLVPGMGQVVAGETGRGILFFC